MQRVLTLVFAVVAAVAIASLAVTGIYADDQAAPIFGIKIPPGYRDWKLISVAHEEGNLNDLRALLGNDIAITAYREGKLPFRDGSIIARVAWSYVPSEENNKVFGRQQSFVAGPPTNVQFMVKDSKKYAATGGWGFAQFKDGKPDLKADLNTCFPLPCAREGPRLRLHAVRTQSLGFSTCNWWSELGTTPIRAVRYP